MDMDMDMDMDMYVMLQITRLARMPGEHPAKPGLYKDR